jgi:hypothetical protein
MRNEIILFLTLVLFGIGCANIKPRSGGDEDKVPPTGIYSEPSTLTTNFIGNSFSIEFDEWIQLNDIYNQLVISPPLDSKPEVRIKKRTLHSILVLESRIILKETLQRTSSMFFRRDQNLTLL